MSNNGKQVKTLRETDYQEYAFRKYCRRIDLAPPSVRRTWTIDGIQHQAALFANAVVTKFPDKPVIRISSLGDLMINGESFTDY